MIRVSRLNGGTLGLNADLIERIEQTPDTVVTLVDGKKLLLIDTPDEIIEKVVTFRATVLARVPFIDTTETEIQPVLRVVSDREEL
ncbi:MAG: flagellar FlbD family protein [Actinomycetia bacterium]|nr:flagellar FlbD family protein [Actinomycetes bacterium]MCP4085642.1 flagellar FlbD family protein [Actinomycetes bacterium]